jgi:ornithine carbamoyltransferase
LKLNLESGHFWWNGNATRTHTKRTQAVDGADIVYTDTFVSMGDEGNKGDIIRMFAGLQVTQELMNAAAPGALFMHDMPAYVVCFAAHEPHEPRHTFPPVT